MSDDSFFTEADFLFMKILKYDLYTGIESFIGQKRQSKFMRHISKVQIVPLEN